MKNLLYKDFRLIVHPLYYLVTLTGALLLIPQWPYFIAMMYFFFITMPNLFMVGKTQNDIGFSVMLPVRKRDIVGARLVTVIILEVLQIIVAALFAILNITFYPAGNFLLDTNVAFFGLVFVMYGLFNAIYFPMFYKTAYKVGVPVIIAITASVVFTGAVETLALVSPAAAYALDGISGEALVRQLPVLAAGIVVFALLNLLAYRVSAKRFERINL